ncbi:hypothetical protein N8456_07940 [Porticoccaceae bacterium]|nr:hypothetical protein [Porticoccaceae bacterium]
MINKTKLIVKVIIQLTLLLQFDFIKFALNKNKKKCDYAIIRRSLFNFKYLSEDRIIKDVSMFQSFLNQGKSVSTYTDINKVPSSVKLLISNADRMYQGESNYTKSFQAIIKNMAGKHSNIFPNIQESMLWENKIHMHREFTRLGIVSPETHVISKNDNIDDFIDKVNPCEYIIKEVHSCGSNGIYKIVDNDFLKNYHNGAKESYLVQRRINMSKDLRVIFVGKRVVHYYWRINKSKEWRPTSTSNGSKVDFEHYPINHTDRVLSVINKLNIRTGAFDICWENDDILTEPIILEVSPFFQPNPKPSSKEQAENYGEWKKSIGVNKRSYLFNHIRLIKSISQGITNEIDNF